MVLSSGVNLFPSARLTWLWLHAAALARSAWLNPAARRSLRNASPKVSTCTPTHAYAHVMRTSCIPSSNSTLTPIVLVTGRLTWHVTAQDEEAGMDVVVHPRFGDGARVDKDGAGRPRLVLDLGTGEVIFELNGEPGCVELAALFADRVADQALLFAARCRDLLDQSQTTH